MLVPEALPVPLAELVPDALPVPLAELVPAALPVPVPEALTELVPDLTPETDTTSLFGSTATLPGRSSQSPPQATNIDPNIITAKSLMMLRHGFFIVFSRSLTPCPSLLRIPVVVNS